MLQMQSVLVFFFCFFFPSFLFPPKEKGKRTIHSKGRKDLASLGKLFLGNE